MATKTDAYPMVRTDADGSPVYQVGALEVRNYDTMTESTRKFVGDVAQKVAGNADNATLEIVSGILDADTVDDILAESEVVHAEQMVGAQFTLRAVKWGRSTFGEGLPFYALMTVSKVGDTAETLVSCSATNVMAQVWQLERRGFLPCDVMLVESARPTANGFRPMRLVPATVDKPF